MKVKFIMQIAFIERFKRTGPFIKFICFLMISEAVIANAEPNAGEKSAAIGADKALLLKKQLDSNFFLPRKEGPGRSRFPGEGVRSQSF